MKRVIFLFLLFITINVYAEERTFIDQEYMNIYYNGVTNNTFISNRFVYKEHEGVPLYCLSFNIPISSEFGYGIYELKDVNKYTQDQKKYIELISYFGYKYEGHEDINYYLAAQDLIWSSLGNDVYWTYTKNGSDYLDLYEYKMDILNLYAEYMNENILLNENYSLEVGNGYSYEDNNILLKQYNYYYSGPNQIRQNIYGINVEAYVKGQDSITLLREFEKGYESKLFMEDGYQTILKGGTLPSRKRILNFDVRNTSLKLIRTNIYDSTNTNDTIKLSWAVYNIYDSNNNYITSVTTDENGEAVVYDLPLGTFKIKEESPSYGFEPIEYYVQTDLIFGETPKTEILYVTPIEKELNITNIYKIDNVEYFDSGIKFEIYRNNVLVKILETDSNGHINTSLEYGKYLVRQLNSRDGFDLEPEFEFEINEQENNLNYIFVKEKNIEINTIIEEPIPEVINEEGHNPEGNIDTNVSIEEENVVEELETTNEKPIENIDTKLMFETNNKISIDKLPRLSEEKDIVDILCENLLYYFCS